MTKKAVQPTVPYGKGSIDAMKTTSTKKPAQSLITKVTMFIEPDLMGRSQGNTFEIYGVNASSAYLLEGAPGSQIILEGPVEMVSAAIVDIKENLMCKTRLFIEKDRISKIIYRARRAKRIRSMKEAFNVRISMKEDGEVVVTGSRDQEAKKAIEEKLLYTLFR